MAAHGDDGCIHCDCKTPGFRASAGADPEPRARTFAAITDELDRAYAKHGSAPWGRHEFYAILLEEVEETWEAIKSDEPLDRVAKEAVQVAAMCIRYLETGDRYQGAIPALSDRVQSPEGHL